MLKKWIKESNVTSLLLAKLDEDVYNLFEDQFLNQSISFRNECSIDDSLYLSYPQYFEEIKKDKGVKLIKKKEDENQLFSNVFQNVQFI